MRRSALQMFLRSMRLTFMRLAEQRFAVGVHDVQVISETSTRALSRHRRDAGGHRYLQDYGFASNVCTSVPVVSANATVPLHSLLP